MPTIDRMETKKRRLINARALAKRAGSLGKFAERIDREPSQISHMIGKNPTRNIGDPMARHIEKCFNLETGWLDEPHDNVVRLLPHLRDGDATQQLREVGPGPELTTPVPLLSWPSVGHWLNHGGDVVEVAEKLSCPVIHGDKTYALEVRGASMEPRFHAGQHIFIDPDKKPVTGSYVIAQLGESSEPVFRRYISEGGSSYLEAINPAWPNRFIPLTDDVRIFGTVIYTGHRV